MIFDNTHPEFYNLFELPMAHCKFIQFDNMRLIKSLELFTHIHPFTTFCSQTPIVNTNSDVSLQTLPSSSHVLVNTHAIDNFNPQMDLLSIPPKVTPQSPHMYNTPSFSPSPTSPNINSHSHDPLGSLPPFSNPFPVNQKSLSMTTKPQSFSSTMFNLSLASSNNPPISSHPTLNNSNTCYEPYASLHPLFKITHNPIIPNLFHSILFFHFNNLNKYLNHIYKRSHLYISLLHLITLDT